MPATSAHGPRPLEINRHGDHDILIRWNTGEDGIYPARFLRGQCPCATCVDELTGKRIVTPNLLPILVYPTKIEPVGRYAIQVFWSDGHSTGIYTWERLYALLAEIPRSPPVQ
ncbi:MAG: DUF971 domain-containing protein [Bryobacterales bacterium]|nr:DUF971 domain-containing protein [Bryobacterales bacterium]